jgi:hypothetical protein
MPRRVSAGPQQKVPPATSASRSRALSALLPPPAAALSRDTPMPRPWPRCLLLAVRCTSSLSHSSGAPACAVAPLQAIASSACGAPHRRRAALLASLGSPALPHALHRLYATAQPEDSTPARPRRRDAFAPLHVPELLVPRLADKQIRYPTPVQEAAVPLILEGRSCAVQSFTGSGKTLAYLLPILTRLLGAAPPAASAAGAGAGQHGDPFQAVVVAPSHELCMQIVRQAHELLPERQHDVQQAICSASLARQSKSLAKHKPALVVGTPARLALLIEQGHLRVYRRQLLVVDEVGAGGGRGCGMHGHPRLLLRLPAPGATWLPAAAARPSQASES